jgi:hypothetical protein
MTRIALVPGVLALSLLGCSMSADTAVAEKQVQTFHQLFDAGEFADIYDRSADELRKATSKREFVALLEAVHRKLGHTKSSDKVGWNVNYQTSGEFVSLNYKTAYENGDANEQFVFLMHDQTALLAGYVVNSTALILR